jgi:hypothetical protein
LELKILKRNENDCGGSTRTKFLGSVSHHRGLLFVETIPPNASSFAGSTLVRVRGSEACAPVPKFEIVIMMAASCTCTIEKMTAKINPNFLGFSPINQSGTTAKRRGHRDLKKGCIIGRRSN